MSRQPLAALFLLLTWLGVAAPPGAYAEDCPAGTPTESGGCDLTRKPPTAIDRALPNPLEIPQYLPRQEREKEQLQRKRLRQEQDKELQQIQDQHLQQQRRDAQKQPSSHEKDLLRQRKQRETRQKRWRREELEKIERERGR